MKRRRLNQTGGRALLGLIFLSMTLPIAAQTDRETVPAGPASEDAEQALPLVSQEDLSEMLRSESVEQLEKRLEPVQEVSPANAHSIRLLWAFRMRNIPFMRELLSRQMPGSVAEEGTGAPDMTENLFFESLDQYDSFLLLLQAAIALEEGRPEQVRETAGDIIWRYPDHAPILADMVTEYQMNQQMQEIQVPMELTLETSQGEQTSLGKLVEGQKGILLEFWASWAGPTLQLMPQLINRAEKLGAQQLVVAAVNTENDSRLAETFRKERAVRFPWLMEPEGAPLRALLHVDSMPRDVLLDEQGNVLFNGHPNDPRLQEALAKLGVELE